MITPEPRVEKFSMFGQDLVLEFEPHWYDFQYFLVCAETGEQIEMWVERPSMADVGLTVERWLQAGEIDANEHDQEAGESLSHLTQMQVGNCIYLIDHVPFFTPEFEFPVGNDILRVAHIEHGTGEPEWLSDEELDTMLVMWDAEGSVTLRTAFEMMIG